MLEEFDKLAISFIELDYLTKKEIKERVRKRHELIKKMSDKEFNIIMQRRIPYQAKIEYSRIRNNKEVNIYY